jgi:predicted dehydrogenase
VRVGIVGCGAITRRSHLPTLQAAGAELVAFSSRTKASAEAAAAEAGSGVVVPDWRNLVALPDLDAVVIATPNAQHAAQALAAIEHGKHVLVEKPFTITVADADLVLAAAERYGVVVMTAHNARFAPPVQTLAKAVRTGEVGMVQSVRGVFCHPGPEDWSAASSWFLEREQSGGGALIDLGVHLVDSLRFVLDDEVVQVSASLSGLLDGVERDAVMLLDTRAGAVGSVHAGWRSGSGPEFSLTVAGERGTLVATATGVTVTGPDGVARTLPLADDAGTVQDAFVRAVRAGRAEHPTGYDGRAAVEVVQACYTSAREGRAVLV